jgi:hypothetical protein
MTSPSFVFLGGRRFPWSRRSAMIGPVERLESEVRDG